MIIYGHKMLDYIRLSNDKVFIFEKQKEKKVHGSFSVVCDYSSYLFIVVKKVKKRTQNYRAEKDLR